ncbi:hypothetical protein [Metapseudomonas otitidis]|nr:hypothetical protein [Pseudomonas otitidis]
MSLESPKFYILLAMAEVRGNTPADFVRSPVRIGGIWYCEVRK